MTWQKDMAARLLQLRRQKGISQEELAAAVGVSRQAVSKWESGQSQPETEKLLALGSYFGVSLDWLLLGKETPPAQPAAKHGADGRAFLAAATALIWCGLLLGWALWDYRRTSLGAVLSLCAAVLALAVFYYKANEPGRAGKPKLLARFWLLNIWPLAMLLVSVGFGILYNSGLPGGGFSPLAPVLGRPVLLQAYVFGGIVCPVLLLGAWLSVCLAVAFWAWRRAK